MINPDALRKQAANKYPEIITALLRDENPFPLRLRYSHIQTTDTREAIQRDIAMLREESREKLGYGLTIEWEEINITRHGRNRVPAGISLACAEDYFAYIGKTEESQNIRAAADALLAAFPGFKPRLHEHWRLLRDGNASDAEFWKHAITVIQYLKNNPFPYCYIRELPIPIPTKFIETNKTLVERLLRALSPASLRETAETFEERLGLKTPDALVECRLLDNTLCPDWKFRQFTVATKDLEHLADIPAHTFLITENRTNFLTLPSASGLVALQGQGYAVTRLRHVPFLKNRRLLYWGDLDPHGFEILAHLRNVFPQTESLMMDADTWNGFQIYQKKTGQSRNNPNLFLPLLTKPEAALFSQILDDQSPSHQSQRLEQEHIPQSWVLESLQRKLSSPPPMPPKVPL
jgi:hypothetical protein